MDFILREKYASMFVMSLEDTFENTRYNGGNMKSKRLVAMLMAGCMALSFTACKKEEKSNKESESASQNTTQNAEQKTILYTYDYLKKITPGIDTEGAVVYKVDVDGLENVRLFGDSREFSAASWNLDGCTYFVNGEPMSSDEMISLISSIS